MTVTTDILEYSIDRYHVILPVHFALKPDDLMHAIGNTNLTLKLHQRKNRYAQGSKLAGARVHGAPRNLAVHPSFKSWVTQ